ncbi:hypothetical protein [Streptomyces sp. NPDC007905]|uniref:hypothetical protein n=1 Tax=Streptomyces sp. NPDC007905 TaxID=3364788 RepID=UPI0036ECD337
MIPRLTRRTARTVRLAEPLVDSVPQLARSAVLLLVGGDSPLWLLLAVAALLGTPRCLIGLAARNALYRRAHPERIASAPGLPRTFMCLRAHSASAATAAFRPHRAGTAGLHGPAAFMLADSDPAPSCSPARFCRR